MGDWAKNAPKIYGHSFSVAEEQSILVKLIHKADSIAASEANNKNKNNQVEDKATPHIIKDGVLPKGYKPIVMSNVEEYLRSQGGIDTIIRYYK